MHPVCYERVDGGRDSKAHIAGEVLHANVCGKWDGSRETQDEMEEIS